MKSSTPQPLALPFAKPAGAVTSALVTSLVSLNLFDTVATLLTLSPSLEANPLASAVLARSPLCFVLLKLLLVWSGAMVLGATESVRALALLVGIYLGVCVSHVVLLLSHL